MKRVRNVVVSCVVFGTLACGQQGNEMSAAPPAKVETVQQAIVLQAPTIFVGSYAALMVPYHMKKEELQVDLPPFLDFGPTALTNNPTKHPVAIQHQHYLTINGSSDRQWDEFNQRYIVDLKIKDGVTVVCNYPVDLTGTFTYLPVTYSTDDQAIFLGNLLFGLNQFKAAITITPDFLTPQTYDLTSLDAASPITYHADFGALEPVSGEGPGHLAAWAASLNAPVFGWHPGTNSAPWHQTDWGFDAPTADIASVSTVVVTSSSPSLSLETVGINQERLGSFRIQAPFAATIPVSCTYTLP